MCSFMTIKWIDSVFSQTTVVPESKLEQESDIHPVTDVTKTTDSEDIKSGQIALDSEPSKISCE